jgi:hypothetical protein
MQLTPRDPLLAAARVVLIVAMGLTVAAAAALTIASVAVVVMRGTLDPTFLGAGLGSNFSWVVVVILGLLLVASVLSFFFLRHLYRIVGTVAEGDPFVAINADRFQAMAWISLATDLILSGVAIAAQQWPHDRHDHVDFNFAFAGLLLALVLFVIARVFREGTRMREELEGMV